VPDIPTPQAPPGGQGESLDGELSRSDLALIREAARNDWPIPPLVRTKITQRLVDYLDRDHEDGGSAPDRVVIAAARALAAFCGLSLRQQWLDLARQKVEGAKGELSLSELVAEAEARAEARKAERDI